MSQYVRYPSSTGGGIATYADFASLPISAADGTLAITLDTYTLYVFEIGSGTWHAEATPDVALSIGVINSQSPSANGAVLTVGGSLVFQSASATVPGMVDTTTQILAGVKTFSSAPNLSSLTASLPLKLDASKNIVSAAIDLGTAEITGTLGVGHGGTGLTTGTSGGILGFTGSGTIASSAALTANALVLGGGAGSTPSTPVGLGTTISVLHGNAAGAPSYGAVVLTADVSGILPVANGGTSISSAGTMGNLLTSDGTNWISQAPATSGTVTSVGLSLPSFITVSGSPVTGSGTLTGTLATFNPNRVFASPVSGVAAAPTFRLLDPLDIPSLPYVSSVALSLPSFITVSGSPVTSTGTLTGTLATQSANIVFAGPTTGSAAAPTFRALVAADVPSLSYVSSVALSAPAEFTVTGSPVTSTGTLTFGKALQNNNTVYAGPSSAGPTAPTFRALVASDIPNLPASIITSGQLAVAQGGTGLSSPGTTGNVLTSNGSAWISQAPGAASYVKPTIQTFLATGTQTGWLFTISTSTTCAVGDTYTNNSNTFTVLGALSAQSGQVLFMSGTGATSGSTLTRATGAGTASVTFSAKIATATYTPTSGSILYIKVQAVGGGGGGDGTSAGAAAGLSTFFGANIINAGGGAGAQNTSGDSVGGAATITTSASVIKLIAVAGSNGQNGQNNALAGGGQGGSSYFGGSGNGAWSGTNGGAAATNSGSGGGGGGSATAAASHGGGASGGYCEAIITTLAASYPYIVGTGGAPATGAPSGGTGAAGQIIITELYQ